MNRTTNSNISVSCIVLLVTCFVAGGANAEFTLDLVVEYDQYVDAASLEWFPGSPDETASYRLMLYDEAGGLIDTELLPAASRAYVIANVRQRGVHAVDITALDVVGSIREQSPREQVIHASDSPLDATSPPESNGVLGMSLVACDSRNFPFVYLTVRVTEDGQPIDDLLPGNFSLTEDGRLQTDAFDVTPPGTGGGVRLADIVFLIDTSGSMSGEIAAVRNNAIAFANALAASNIDYRLGLVRFGNSSGANPGIIGGGLTANAQTFTSWVGTLGASGSFEPGFAAVRLAISTYSFRPGAQKVFILITDEDSDDRNKQSTIDLIQANDVTVHCAVSCSSGSSNSDYCDSTSIRGVSGGLLFGVAGPYDQVLNTIAGDVANTYIVRYRTDNPVFDGQERQVACTVSNGFSTDTVQCTYMPGGAPIIERTPETIALQSQPLVAGSSPTIAATVRDAAAPFVQGVTLYTRITGSGAAFTQHVMPAQGQDVYAAAVPGAFVQHPGLDYYIRATDGQVTSSDPSTDPDATPYQIAVLPNVSPVVLHTPYDVWEPAVALPLTVRVLDDTYTVSAITVHYRSEGALQWFAETASFGVPGPTDVTQTLGIPAERVVEPALEYYFSVVDDLGVSSLWPAGGADAPQLLPVRSTAAQLCERLTEVAQAAERYQRSAVDVWSWADVDMARSLAKSEDLSNTIKEFGLDLVASGTPAKIIGKMAKNSWGKASVWLSKTMVPKLRKQVRTSVFFWVAKHADDWFSAGTGIDWHDSDAEIYQYIRDYLLADEHLGSVIEQTGEAAADVCAQLPTQLPEDFPTEAVLAELKNIELTFKRVKPVSGRTLEENVYWSVPGQCSFEPFGNLNPALLGTTSYAAADLGFAAGMLTVEDTATEIRRYSCIAWVVGGGALKILATLTVAGAPPAEALYWSGVSVCSAATLVNEFADFASDGLAMWKQFEDLATLHSDVMLVADFVDAVGDEVLSLVDNSSTCSTNMNFGALSVPDVSSGWFELFAEASATVEVTNNGDTTGKVRALLNVYKKSGSTYDDLVLRAGSDAGELSIPSTSSGVIEIDFEVPIGNALFADRYYTELRMIGSAGAKVRSAFFRACHPLGCFFDDVWDLLTGGAKARDDTVEYQVQADANAVRMEFVLSYTGRDVDLHVWDSIGNHVGVEYATGDVDLQIPNATYSGRESYPEVIEVPVLGDGLFTVQVVNRDPQPSDDFSVLVRHISYHPATMVVGVDHIQQDVLAGETVSYIIPVGELGEQEDLTEFDVGVTELTSAAGDVIGADATDFLHPGQIIAAGTQVFIRFEVTAPLDAVGTYWGDVAFYSNAGDASVPVELRVVGQVAADVVASDVRFDRRTGRSTIGLQVHNAMDEPIGMPLLVVFTEIVPAEVQVAEPSGVAADGRLYIDWGELVGDDWLDAGESVSGLVSFDNPERRRFYAQTSVYGVADGAVGSAQRTFYIGDLEPTVPDDADEPGPVPVSGSHVVPVGPTRQKVNDE